MEFIKQSVQENTNGMAVEAPTYPWLPPPSKYLQQWSKKNGNELQKQAFVSLIEDSQFVIWTTKTPKSAQRKIEA